jgi:thioredoxin reductase
MNNTFDAAVIGGGAAGLSAALVLLRARRSVAVFDAGAPRNAPAAHMHGFLSRDGVPPAELLAFGREEIARYGGTRVEGTVIAVAGAVDTGFTVRLVDGRAIGARRILITTGLTDEIPDIPGLRQRWGRDVLHCPYCHGYEVRDQPVGVMGGSGDAVAHALLIRQWTHDVLFFSHTTPPDADQREQLVARGIRIVDGPIAGLRVDDDALAAVRLADGTEIPRTALFVRPRFSANDDLLIGLGGRRDDAGWAIRDEAGRTSVPGVYVAGNAADPRAQVITAAGQGSAAAITLNTDLVAEESAADLAALRAR